MPLNVTKTLRDVLDKLEGQRARISSQIAAIRSAIDGAPASAALHGRGRRSMSPARRAEVSRRMKAYWAKRRKPGK